MERVGEVSVALCGNFHSDRILLLSPGFASALTDYGPVVRRFEKTHLVVRVGHPQNGRSAGLQALLLLDWHRWVGRLGAGPAARRVREWVHGRDRCLRRVAQFEVVADWLEQSFPGFRLSVLGHSFGTDTVLRFALRRAVESVYLLSPHPPGYLVNREGYARLMADRILVITGTRDVTRDGVGPEQRLAVAGAVPAGILEGAWILPEVGHMDFAFTGLGPEGWEQALGRAIGSGNLDGK